MTDQHHDAQCHTVTDSMKCVTDVTPTGMPSEAGVSKVLDHGYVKFIEAWGSDERVIESARMSTDGSFQGWERDERLLRYLWKNHHHTPFEMAGITVEIQAPIFVIREWQRHRTQSYNEMSGRYVELPDLYYIPSIERLMAGGQSQTNRQASGEAISREQAIAFQTQIKADSRAARESYELMLSSGLARELARLVIPVNQYSRMRASANLRNWLAFLTLRLADDAQWEIRQYAEAVAMIVKERFPRTYDLFDRQLAEREDSTDRSQAEGGTQG